VGACGMRHTQPGAQPALLQVRLRCMALCILTLHEVYAPWVLRLRVLCADCIQCRTLAPEGGAPAYGTWTPSRCGVGSSKTTAASGAHLVQGALLLLPAGTTYRGTPKQYSVGKVQDVLLTILAQAGRSGTVPVLRAKATASPPHRLGSTPATCCGLHYQASVRRKAPRRRCLPAHAVPTGGV
jgi:hypothetical protein